MRADFFIRKSTERDYEALCEIYEEIDSLHAEALPHVFRKADRPARSRDLILGVIADENSALFVAETGTGQ